MKFIFLALVLVIGLAASVALVINKKELVTRKTESAFVNFNVKDFPEHGISLIAPSDATIGNLMVKLVKPSSTSIDDSYSVFLKNAGSHAVVGYSIKWECFDDRGDAPDRDVSNDRHVSNIISYVFLHGEE